MSAQIDPLIQALEFYETARRADPECRPGDVVAQIVAANPAVAGQRPRLLRELIKLDLEYRCYESGLAFVSGFDRTDPYNSESFRRATGDIPLLEAYLEQSPDVSFGDDSLLELIEHEYCVRYHSQEPLDPASYTRRFPHLGDVAVRRLQNLREDLAVESSIRSLWNQPDPLADDSDGIRDADVAAFGPAGEFDDSVMMDALLHIRPFSELSGHARQAVVEKLVLQPFQAGDVLLHQGDVADSLLILLDGIAEVTVEDEQSVHSIARLGPNTVVGEIGLFAQAVRSANVVATRPGYAAVIARDDFEHIAGRYPRLSIALSELIAERVGTLAIDCLCGKLVDRYLVKHRLGRGAMGIVYAAADDRQNSVALKMLRHDLNFDRMATLRFHQEAEIVRGLEHPNIVRVYDAFSAFGTCFICMELCDGIPLSELVRHAGGLPLEFVRAITGQMASGLLRAHQAGIAHRDLKPANVLLTKNGLAKLADFGLARSLTDDVGLTQFGQIVGTPRYMAPEQLSGERGDARSDLFALGCITYELLTGVQLFRARKFSQLIQERCQWSLPNCQDIPAQLDEELYELLKSCLREVPEQRDADLAEIAAWASPVAWSTLYADDDSDPASCSSTPTTADGATRVV
jgi:Protein kinase domain/Cyclic nucleotide-binding domain